LIEVWYLTGTKLLYGMLYTLLILIMLMILTGRGLFQGISSLCVQVILSKASLQSIAALSTIEAEYIVAAEGVKEAT